MFRICSPICYEGRGLRALSLVLYDFDKESDFVPTDDELNECLDGYLDLLTEVPPDSPEELRDMSMMDASELTLAYLARWRAGKEVTLDRARVDKGSRLLLTHNSASAASLPWLDLYVSNTQGHITT